jgi:hypothetical protein
MLGLVCCLTTIVRADEPVAAEPPITDENREHWSFQPLANPTVPAVRDSSWCRTPIDRFVLAELEKRDLKPMSEADRATLLRRVTFDLTGLPPTPEELAAFLADDDPAAYERAVDRLLASPGYAERQAQHWLDVARFADTDGFEFDTARPNAWRYRDWVIAALDADMPYADFVARQIAGDLIGPDEPQSNIATGFLLCGPDMPDINLQEERRHTVLNEMTSAVGEVFLGLQMGCASCHDHKFDPISQRDFYRLRAFFEPCELFKEQPLATADQRAELDEFERTRAKRWKEIETEKTRLEAEDPETNAEAIKRLDRELKELKSALPPSVTTGRVVRQKRETTEAHFYVRGDFRRPGETVEPAAPRIAFTRSDEPTAVPRDRRALADWMASSDNALAMRAIVNRLWQSHFGRGIFNTPSDVGFMGGAPSHPELLDWLAGEFVRQGGSLKAMHRLMVTSAVYRTASRSSGDDAEWRALTESDTDNKWLGRMQRRRLEGEAIRDAMLSVSDRLNDERWGEGVRPPLPQEVVGTLLKDQWNVTPDRTQHNRRSVYLFVRRNLRFPLFEVFDRPDTNQSCPRRHESTTAPQALTLLNSEFTWECAKRLADRIQTEGGDQADLACQIVLARSATDSECTLLRDADDLTLFCVALLNASEFLYVD